MTKIIASDRGLNRRMAVKAMIAMGLASTGGSDLGRAAFAASSAAEQKPGSGPAGTLSDPDLRNPVVPWDRTLSSDALRTLEVLCDLILPADERLPAASALGAPAFIDEWVSAPYEEQQIDRQAILDGLRWLDATAERRFGAKFHDLDSDQQHTMLEAIAFAPVDEEADEPGVRFFARVRDLTAAAVWTTPEGMADLGYMGNVPLARWDPPPAEVLRHLGLKP
jgi:hypothetical protein